MKIFKTKKGQPYVIGKDGRARFIKKSKSSYSRRRYNTMARKRSYKKTASSILGKLNKPVMGAIGVVAYEAFLSPKIPVQGVAKDILELVGGLYLSKKGGILGATGQSLVVLNAYQLAAGLAKGQLSNLVGGSNGSSAMVYG